MTPETNASLLPSRKYTCLFRILRSWTYVRQRTDWVRLLDQHFFSDTDSIAQLVGAVRLCVGLAVAGRSFEAAQTQGPSEGSRLLTARFARIAEIFTAERDHSVALVRPSRTVKPTFRPNNSRNRRLSCRY
jgi:hypothetical protein